MRVRTCSRVHPLGGVGSSPVLACLADRGVGGAAGICTGARELAGAMGWAETTGFGGSAGFGSGAGRAGAALGGVLVLVLVDVSSFGGGAGLGGGVVGLVGGGSSSGMLARGSPMASR